MFNQVLDKVIEMMTELWNTLGSWGLFGSFLMFTFIMRKVWHVFRGSLHF